MTERRILVGDQIFVDLPDRGPGWLPVDDIVGSIIWVIDSDGKDYEVEYDDIEDHEELNK